MWLWISLCFASTVLAQNDIPSSGTTEISKKYANEEVLLKIWTILADLLDEDGKTVKVPSRDHVQLALTLIKKTILEHTDSPNVDLKEKLFLKEAELAKYKSIYIHDSRPLQTLLELIPDKKSNVILKYELIASDKPNCKQAFKQLIETVYQKYNNLFNSPVCSEGPINVQSSINSLYNPGEVNQYDQLNINIEPLSNNIGDNAATWNSNNDVVDLMHNSNSSRIQGEVNNVFGAAQIPVSNTNEQNNLFHAVKLSKDTHHLIENDYVADLQYAKKVADKINALYQSNKTQTPQIGSSVYPKQPLRKLNPDGTVNIQRPNNPWVSSQNSMPVIQGGYITQSQVNPLNNGWNQSYTIITNTIQSQLPVKNTIVNHDYTKPLNTFVNSKYHPNHNLDTESHIIGLPSNAPIGNVENIPQTDSVPSIEKLPYNFVSQPYQDKQQSTEIPQPANIAQYPYKTNTKTIATQLPGIPNNKYLNYNIYSYPKPNYQNSYAYKPGYNPYGLKLNYYNNPYRYYSQLPALRPGYTKGYNYMFQQSVFRPQGNLFTVKHLNQIPNTIYGQKIIQTLPPAVQTYNMNTYSKPIQNYAYGMTHIQTNVPQFTRTDYYNGQPVIDKLADWVSGTNSAKSNPDNNEAEVELTYLIKKPPPQYSPAMFYIKFRMPYKSFAKHVTELLNPQTSRSDSPDTDLYTNLASQYNATIVPSDMFAIPEEIKSKEDNLLVRARYIEPNEPGKDNPNTVDIINLVKEPELSQVNIENSVNTEANNAQIPVLLN